MNQHILIVEDDANINAMMNEYLIHHNYFCTPAYSGSEARLLLAHNTYDLILLDLMLPGVSGEILLKEIKTDNAIPIIILSAKDSIDSKVALLREGADDYMCKPFNLKELEARIQVQLRKYIPSLLKEEKIFRSLQLCNDYKTIKIDHQTQVLTKHEFKILELLMSDVKRAYTKKDIYEYAWEDGYYGDDKTINVHVSNLRSKIAKISKEEYIETIWGIGFKMKC